MGTIDGAKEIIKVVREIKINIGIEIPDAITEKFLDDINVFLKKSEIKYKLKEY